MCASMPASCSVSVKMLAVGTGSAISPSQHVGEPPNLLPPSPVLLLPSEYACVYGLYGLDKNQEGLVGTAAAATQSVIMNSDGDDVRVSSCPNPMLSEQK